LSRAETYEAVVTASARKYGSGQHRPQAPRGDRLSDPQQLAKLNAWFIPREDPERLWRRIRALHPDGIAVTEAAILVETGSYKDYDRLIVAVCGPEQQIERAMERNGASREEVLNRLRRQMPLDDKVKYADFVIDTSGSKENTLAQTRTVHEALRRLNP
jgi:dephospho-CoA kinase